MVRALAEPQEKTSSASAAAEPPVVPPSFAIVICTRDRPFHLRACLEAVQHLAYPGAYEVVVVDNGTGAETQALARQFGARYIAAPGGGLSHARNAGLAAAQDEIVAFLDDDALPRPGWLNALAAEYDDPAVMAVSGSVVPVTGQDDSVEAGRLRGSYSGGKQRRVVTRAAADWFAMANFGGLGIGANMSFRRGATAFWRGFDERLGRGAPLHAGEETYALASILKAGYAVVYTPAAIVEHPFCPPAGDVVERRLQAHAASTAYVTFLLMEEPAHFWQVLRYLARRATRRSIPWRDSSAESTGAQVSRWRAAAAALAGPALYFRYARRRPAP